MTTAIHKRREEDVKKIEKIASQYQGIIELLGVTGNPISNIRLRLNVPTAKNQNYPDEVQKYSDIKVSLTARYPFEPPKVEVLTPVWNPNIYTSGVICLGTKWLPTQGLDLLLLRIIQLLAYDSLIINTQSPANSQACSWYMQTKNRYPTCFPTFQINTMRKKQDTGIKWKNIQVEGQRMIIISCSKCSQRLRIPEGKPGRYTCPSCKNSFNV